MRDLDRFAAWPRTLSWLPIPLLLATTAVIWAMGLRTSHESPSLLLAFNLVCSTLASLLVVILAGRSFLVRGTPGLLSFGCGVLMWGAAGTLQLSRRTRRLT